MKNAEIIELSGEVQSVAEDMDPINAIIFVLKYKYEKELDKETVRVFDAVVEEMNLPVREYRNWTDYRQLRESFYHYVRTHIPPSKMNMMLAMLDSVNN